MTLRGNMEVVSLKDAQPRSRRLAIGTFDGVHLGHQAVIEGATSVLTFDPHPMQVIRPDKVPPLLTSFEVKRDVIAGLGVEELIVIEFNREVAQIPAERFIDEILVAQLGAEWVSVGDNFNFGAGAKGDADMLRAHDEFETRVVSLVEVDGEPVSSTRIRRHVAEGEMEMAQRCLGSPFMVEGEVVSGDRRGRELGFPTANLVPNPDFATPKTGVYAAFANGVPAAVNVGVRPTFDSDLGLLIEAHLIDHDEDLYGRNLRVAFVTRLRDEMKFDDVNDLIAQMERDVEAAGRVCASFQR
jgi:riboflavin kinase/FMN adenylyltransferase